VGVVGAGLIAQVMHLHYLRELADRFEIAALCDLVPENAAASAARYGIPRTFTDWRDLLREPLDAVLVLTSASHAPMAIEAAKAGIHVLVEKPMCFSVVEGRQMVAAAAEAGVILMVAYNKRYDPAYLRFRDEAAAMADPRFMRVTTFESPLQPYIAHYELTPPAAVPAQINPLSEQGITEAIGEADDFLRRIYRSVLLDTLVHELNGVRGVLGEPDRLDYVDLREGSLTAMLRFGDLPVAIHWLDLPGIARYKMEFALYGPSRRLTLSFPSPFLRSEPTVLFIEEGGPGASSSRISEEITSYESPFKRELIAFHDAITNATPPTTPGEDGLRDIRLCESIIESFRRRMPIEGPSLVG
jgi:predicted dehydrogenase